MKKLCTFGVIFLICTGLFVGCGESGNSTTKETNTADNASETTLNKTQESNEDYFTWMDTTITGLTESGKKQTAFVIPFKCETIGTSAFYQNTTIESVTFSNPNTLIRDVAFAGCTSLSSIELPDGLVIIPSEVFSGCTSLVSIDIPDSVTIIDFGAFGWCSNLSTVTFGNGLVTIVDYSFEGCHSLKDINFPDTLTSIGTSAFANCEALVNVSFGDGLLVIKDNAFYMCDGLESIRLPEHLNKLGESAFTFCDNLKEIYIPASIQDIHKRAMTQSHKTTVYVKEGSWADNNFSNFTDEQYHIKEYY